MGYRKTYDETQIRATIHECQKFIDAHKDKKLRIALTTAIVNAYNLIASLEKIINNIAEINHEEKP